MRADTSAPTAAKVVLQHVHHALGQVPIQARHGMGPAWQALQVLCLLCLLRLAGGSTGRTLLCLLGGFGCRLHAGTGDRWGRERSVREHVCVLKLCAGLLNI
jgi:hypothetical protein